MDHRRVLTVQVGEDIAEVGADRDDLFIREVIVGYVLIEGLSLYVFPDNA